MVEPNRTNRDRYSIAWNTETHRMSLDTDAPVDFNWNKFDLDDPKVRG